MFIQDRDAGRRFFIDVWRCYRRRQSLEPLQQQILAVILEHGEYHALLDDPDAALTAEYPPEQGASNPFLHMGMHVALREQAGVDRPAGVRRLYLSLCEKATDRHALEHKMMECLGEALWAAQRDNLPPDEARYLECLKKLG